jgi:hypothetical protein
MYVCMYFASSSEAGAARKAYSPQAFWHHLF